ncbi:hypothetical protein FNV43_RR12157 [Rhamnella rubrinervis]|uniref:Uncharacterized protein n=1 Tax=Rhamnella rubrinervis TaxID=2594499 RepID=A0A8K0MID9_9ROSA|nr:hypothetical protein FNV43_RR12157 [Rhamnella rubrinervis]
MRPPTAPTSACSGLPGLVRPPGLASTATHCPSRLGQTSSGSGLPGLLRLPRLGQTSLAWWPPRLVRPQGLREPSRPPRTGRPPQAWSEPPVLVRPPRLGPTSQAWPRQGLVLPAWTDLLRNGPIALGQTLRFGATTPTWFDLLGFGRPPQSLFQLPGLVHLLPWSGILRLGPASSGLSGPLRVWSTSLPAVQASCGFVRPRRFVRAPRHGSTSSGLASTSRPSGLAGFGPPTPVDLPPAWSDLRQTLFELPGSGPPPGGMTSQACSGLPACRPQGLVRSPRLDPGLLGLGPISRLGPTSSGLCPTSSENGPAALGSDLQGLVRPGFVRPPRGLVRHFPAVRPPPGFVRPPSELVRPPRLGPTSPWLSPTSARLCQASCGSGPSRVWSDLFEFGQATFPAVRPPRVLFVLLRWSDLPAWFDLLRAWFDLPPAWSDLLRAWSDLPPAWSDHPLA